MKSRNSLIRLKRFQVDEKRRQLSQLEMMIAEFQRMAKDLEDQIQTEQNRVGVFDIAHYAYPTFAKAAMQRRDNLMASIEELRVQVETARMELSEAVEEMKKIELLEERDHARDREAEAKADQAHLDEVAMRGYRR